MPPIPRVTVIVVSYNTQGHLRRCLESLKGQAYEIIVVDNASNDGSPEMVEAGFPEVTLIRSELNLGFGRANNLGLDVMTGEIALFLNSDAEPEPGAIDILASTFANPSVVAAGGRLLNADGTTQDSACRPLTLWVVFCEQTMLEKLIHKLGLRPPYWQSRWLLSRQGDARRSGESDSGLVQARADMGPTAFEVAQVMGACLMMRPSPCVASRETVKSRSAAPLTKSSNLEDQTSVAPALSRMEVCEPRRFDPDFFLYCEDTELCHRLCLQGKILYVPDARFHHALGASTSGNRWWSVAMYNRGKELFFVKHHGQLQAFLCLTFNRLGALLRLVLWALRLNRGQVKLFWRVLTAPYQGPKPPPDSIRVAE